MRASVFIPTRNGGERFKGVLRAVLEQQTPWDFEVVVVDSGSNDGTREILMQAASCFPRFKFFEIPPSEFGHGRTRNLGISQCSGEFVALITQDAEPASPCWLVSLIEAVAAVDEAAGGFGRHMSYPETSPFVARDLQAHFDAFAAQHPVRFIQDWIAYNSNADMRQSLHFHSDNNACVRKSYWEKYPLPEVLFGEDQVWAKGVMERGDKLVYVDSAAVRHAHDFTITQAFYRAQEEAHLFFKEFEYKLENRLVKAIKKAFRQTIVDIRFYMDMPKPRPGIKWIRQIGFLNLSRKLGYWHGSRG
jgi:rhamnosyltransferase